MNIRSKIVIKFLLTFLIGSVLGVALDRVIVRHHIRSLFEMRSRGFMLPFQDEILKRTAPESRAAVEALLAAHGQSLTEIDGRFRTEIESSFKALLKDLAAYLTPAKIKEIRSILQGSPPFRDGPPGRPRFKGIPPPGSRGESSQPGRPRPPDPPDHSDPPVWRL
jgi:hypothetical protein